MTDSDVSDAVFPEPIVVPRVFQCISHLSAFPFQALMVLIVQLCGGDAFGSTQSGRAAFGTLPAFRNARTGDVSIEAELSQLKDAVAAQIALPAGVGQVAESVSVSLIR
jgi:hypothetical protein